MREDFTTSNFFDQIDQSQSDGFDFVGILARRKWIVIACAVIGLIGAFVYYLRAEPVYRSEAQVLIKRKAPPNVGLEEFRGYQRRVDDETSEHPFVIMSPRIVGKAYADNQMAELASLKEDENPIRTILENLEVIPVVDEGNIFVISFEGRNSDDTATIVKSIMDVYGDFLEANHRDFGRETRQLISEAKDELLRKLVEGENSYKEFRANAPLMWRDGEGTNLHQERQASIEAERAEVQLQISDLESHLESVKAAIQRGDSVAALAFSAQTMYPGAEQLRPDRGSNEAMRMQQQIRRETMLLPLLLEEEEVLTKYGKDHPKVRSIRRRIKSTREFLLRIVGRQGLDADDGDLDGADADLEGLVSDEEAAQEWYQDLVTMYVESLQHRLQQMREKAASLDELFVREATAAKQLAEHQFRDETYRKDLDRTQQLFDVVVKNLDEVSMVEGYEGYVYEVLADPGIGRQVAPSIIRVFLLGTFASCLFGFGLAYLVDMTDKGFHSPLEISERLQAPVVGHIPLIECEVSPEFGQVDATICALHDPQSHYAESFRTVRTALFFNARGGDHNVIQVTSPRPSDGKSTLTANLAVTIASSGKSVLLVDADFRRPRQHKLFGLDSRVGLASVVQDGTEPSDAYRQIPGVDKLWLMPCGPRPQNPSELLSTPEFRGVVDHLRERFDFLLIDTPPMLAVSDPSVVAAHVDGVLLCLQVDNKSRPIAQRSCEMIREIGAEITGIVINGVGSRDSSYVYSYHAKRYGYDYSYAYKYGDRVAETRHDVAVNGSTTTNGASMHENGTLPQRKGTLDV